jgi:hypothetical protein
LLLVAEEDEVGVVKVEVDGAEVTVVASGDVVAVDSEAVAAAGEAVVVKAEVEADTTPTTRESFR